MINYLILSLVIFSVNSACFLQNRNNGSQKKEKETQNLILAAAVLTSCVPGSNGFYMLNFETGNYECVKASLKYSNSDIDIYVQDGLESMQTEYGINKISYSSIASGFSTNIVPKLKPAIGTSTDINGDKKITVMFFVSSFEVSSGTYVAGFVDPVHFFKAEYGLESNQREIIYINGFNLAYSNQIYSKIGRPDMILSTLAHEYQHLVRLPHQMGRSGITSPIPIPETESELNTLLNFDDTWVDEGSSEVASDIAGYGPQYERMSCLRGDPSTGTTCLGGYNSESLFAWNSSILDYSLAYSFMKYIYESSGSTIDTRNSFFLESVTGKSGGTRAGTASNLMSVFKRASSYSSTLLGSDSTGMFQKLFAVYLAKSLSYESNATPANDTQIFVGNNTALYLNSFASVYPFSSEHTTLFSYPSSIAKTTASLFELTPSQVYRVGNTRSAGSYDSSAVYVKRGTNGGSDPLDAVIFNGNITASTSSIITTKEISGGFSKKTYNPGRSGLDKSCQNDFLKFRFRENLISNFQKSARYGD